VETFLISLFLFLMLFLFISREMIFAVVAVTTTVALLLALAGWRFKLEPRQVSARRFHRSYFARVWGTAAGRALDCRRIRGLLCRGRQCRAEIDVRLF